MGEGVADGGMVVASLVRPPPGEGWNASASSAYAARFDTRDEEEVSALLWGATRAVLVNGVAAFTNLAVARADTAPYTLAFRYIPAGEMADLGERLSVDQRTVRSYPFGVGVGPAASLRLLAGPGAPAAAPAANAAATHGLSASFPASSAPVLGGGAFPVPPVVLLLDAGGNLLADEDDAAVECSFANNPSDGTLAPAAFTLARFRRGVARFSQLRIDRAGVAYALRFTYLAWDPLAREYSAGPGKGYL